jgi:hypothetical protein
MDLGELYYACRGIGMFSQRHVSANCFTSVGRLGYLERAAVNCSDVMRIW